MKLVMVEHWRCDEPSGYRTLLWAPDDLTVKKFTEDCEDAQRRYLAAAKALDDKAPQRFMPDMPDREAWLAAERQGLTVAETLAQWREALRINTEAERKRDEARRSFGSFMEELGYRHFTDQEMELVCVLEWGHRHGTVINYSATQTPDVPGMLREGRIYGQQYRAGDPLEPVRER